MKKIKTKQMTIIAIMASLATVFDLLLVKGRIKVSIHALPLIIVGIFFGPYVGLLTGVVAGLLSQLLTYGLSITTPFWILAYASWGFVAGLFSKKIKTKIKSHEENTIFIPLMVIAASFSAYVFNTLASFTQIWLMNDPYYTKASIITDMLPRFLIMIVMVFAHSIIVGAIIKCLDSIVSE